VSVEAFDPFFDFLAFEKRYSPHTLSAYRSDLEQFTVYLEESHENIAVEEVNYQLVRAWVAHLVESGTSPRSVNRKITTLRTYFRFLVRENRVRVNPMLKIQGPKTKKRLPVFVEERPMSNLLDSTAFEEGELDAYDALLVRVMVQMFYCTGMRLAELIGLKQHHVNLPKETLKVLGKRNKERVIPITPELVKLVKAYLSEKKKLGIGADGENHFFQKKNAKKLSRSFVYSRVKTYLSKVTTIDKKSPHVLRHTFATHMLNNGADLNAIKELLGHASLSATQVYTHNTVEKLKSVYHKAHPRA
jgi:integrase/recombinase XerC